MLDYSRNKIKILRVHVFVYLQMFLVYLLVEFFDKLFEIITVIRQFFIVKVYLGLFLLEGCFALISKLAFVESRLFQWISVGAFSPVAKFV
jgi:hypothetical protein